MMIKKPIIIVSLILSLLLVACMVVYANLPSTPTSGCTETMPECSIDNEIVPGRMLWETVSGKFNPLY